VSQLQVINDEGRPTTKQRKDVWAGHTINKTPLSEVYNLDCMVGMANTPDKFYDLAVVDPPYGLGERLTERGGKLKNTPMAVLYRESSRWDILPTNHYWGELFRVSKHQVVAGANYFWSFLTDTRGIVAWDKKQAMPTLSSFELIWTSFDKPAKIFSHVSTDLERFHPTQKPVALYDWIYKNYAKPGDKILDTHLGSGSNRIAAYKAGLDFTGYELDQDYYEAQEKRFAEFVKQERLF